MVKIDNYKTYIIAILMLTAGVLFKVELLDIQTLIAVMTVLTGGGFATTRHAISKMGKVDYE